MRNLLIVILLISASFTSGQTAIDSLQQMLKNDLHDTVRIEVLSNLCFEYRFTDQEKAVNFGNEALKLSQKKGFKRGEAQAYNDLAIIKIYQSNFPEALQLMQKSLEIRKELNDIKGMGAIYNKMGIVYQQSGDIENSLDMQFKALKAFEESNWDYGAAQSYNNIAVLYNNQKNYEKAVQYFKHSIKIKEKINDNIGIAGSLGNLGNIYTVTQKYDSAEYFLKESIRLSLEGNQTDYIATDLNNLYTVYMAQNRLDEAEKCVLESKEIRTKINDLKGISSCLGNLALLEQKRNNLLKAKQYAKEALDLGLQIQSKPEIFHSYEILSTIESKLGNHKDAYDFLALSTLYKDTLINESNIKAVNEVEARFQNEKKQRELNEINAELDRQQLIKNAVFAGLVLALIVFVLIILFIRARQKTAQILQIQKERERIARDLHDNIGSHLTYIIHGIEDTADFYPNVNPQDLQKLADFSRETISQLRQTIWAMHSDHIQADELVNKIKDMAAQYLQSPGAPQLDFKLSGDLSKISLSPNKALNILRIVQEALQNILKHAQAKSVNILAAENSKRFEFSIQDDGKGFNLKESPDNHYGLDNMRKRSDENGLNIRIDSNVGSGTTIGLSI